MNTIRRIHFIPVYAYEDGALQHGNSDCADECQYAVVYRIVMSFCC